MLPMRGDRMMTRGEARQVTCPECDAEPGALCLGAVRRRTGERRERERPHLARYHAAERATP